jgi:hypothetical protein
MKEISKISDKVVFYWDDLSKSVISEWQHFFVEDAEFSNVIQNVILFAKKNNAIGWIIDAKSATSIFRKELFEKLKKQILPKLLEIGILYIIAISPTKNAFAQSTELQYKSEIKKMGFANIEMKNIDEAITFMKNIDK